MRGGRVFLLREADAPPWLDVDGDHQAWVGTIDDQVIGYATVHVESLGEGWLGVIDQLFVESGARSVGVGEALMATVLAWCRSRGCEGIDAAALPGHRATKNFFEESGFTARLLVMHHRLVEEPLAGE
jgi:GNAT superfamily N-acetyltransferase